MQAEGELALKGVHRASQQGGRGKQAGRQAARTWHIKAPRCVACLPAMLHAPFWLASYLSTLVKPAWHLPGRCIQGVCVRVCVCLFSTVCVCVCVSSFLPVSCSFFSAFFAQLSFWLLRLIRCCPLLHAPLVDWLLVCVLCSVARLRVCVCLRRVQLAILCGFA